MGIERRRFLGGLAAAGGALLTGCAGAPAQRGIRRYNTRVIDALKQRNLNVDAIASTPETPGAGTN